MHLKDEAARREKLSQFEHLDKAALQTNKFPTPEQLANLAARFLDSETIHCEETRLKTARSCFDLWRGCCGVLDQWTLLADEIRGAEESLRGSRDEFYGLAEKYATAHKINLPRYRSFYTWSEAAEFLFPADGDAEEKLERLLNEHGTREKGPLGEVIGKYKSDGVPYDSFLHPLYRAMQKETRRKNADAKKKRMANLKPVKAGLKSAEARRAKARKPKEK